LISNLTGTHLHDYGCTLKVYNSKLLKNVKLYGEMHRFIPALAAIEGATITEMPVNHNPRIRGKSKYNLSRTPNVVLDLLTIVFLENFRTKPMHFFGKLALAVFALIITSLFGLLLNILAPIVVVDYSLVTILGTLLIIFGLQLICIGIVAEMIMRCYYGANDKKIYCVEKNYKD